MATTRPDGAGCRPKLLCERNCLLAQDGVRPRRASREARKAASASYCLTEASGDLAVMPTDRLTGNDHLRTNESRKKNCAVVSRTLHPLGMMAARR